MRKIKAVIVLCLVFALCIPLFGCSVLGNGKYNVVARLEKQELCVAFRQNDRAGDAVVAAMKELQAEGEVDSLSRKWFGEERSILKGDDEAISKLDFTPESRLFIVGYDSGRLPFSGEMSKGNPTGFDVEFARLVCEKLRWRIKFVAINVADAKTELDSGNVDCVWGAYPYDKNATGVSQSPAYMKSTIIIASLSGSGVRNSGSLSGKTLAFSENGCFERVLNDNEKTAQKPKYIVKLPGGCNECIKALEDGSCDAIMTDLDAIEYYK